MKKEVFIMHDFKALCRQAHTLVIFKSLHEVPVFEKLLDTLAVCESDSDMAIEKYSDFVAELFAYSDNLTEYMLKLFLSFYPAQPLYIVVGFFYHNIILNIYYYTTIRI